MHKKFNLLLTLVFLILAVALSNSVVMAQDPVDSTVAEVTIDSNGVTWFSRLRNDGLVLTVSGPEGFYLQEKFTAGTTPFFGSLNADGTARPDGSYSYELTTVPLVDGQIRQILDTVTEENRFAVEEQLRQAGKLPESVMQAGSFFIAGGTIIVNDFDEPGNAEKEGQAVQPIPSDQVIFDDLIVDGSACIGQDCVNGESFGFDTLRLKENNLRIKFQDTSNSASFPTNDWQITANDSSNGGANKFSIDDIDGGRTPFTIEAAARTNALYVEADGDIGVGTSNPVVDVHIVTGNTPTVRLEQDGTSGFTPQTWDVAGNEANFFIRDATNGSQLPLQIKPGADSASLFIAADNDIGMGTSSPGAALHVRRTAAASNVDMLLLEAPGTIRTEFKDNTNNQDWRFRFASDKFSIQESTSDEAYQLRMELDLAGNLKATSYSDFSDVNAKENFALVNGADVLARLAEVPISSWNYKEQDPAVRHMGPMAQDFYAAFEVGIDDRHIAPLDTSGVALAAIQALHQQGQEKDAQIVELQEKNASLEARIEALERAQPDAQSSASANSPFAAATPWGLIVVLLSLLLVTGFLGIKVKSAQTR